MTGAKAGTKPAGAHGYDWWRENIEAIVFAFILALVIRHFAVEAFVIPTGSMAPTLFGIHAWSDCPECGTWFNIGLGTDDDQHVSLPYRQRRIYDGKCKKCGLRHRRADSGRGAGVLVPGRTRFRCDSPKCRAEWVGEEKDYSEAAVVQQELECPICQFNFIDVIKQSNQSGGHKILVNKFAFQVGKPERWDVIVFHFDEEKNYIKRLVGLPGETVWIVGGDVYVRRPGSNKIEIARKIDRPDARDSLWIKISDTDVRENGFHPIPAWREIFEQRAGMAVDIESKWWSWDRENESRRWAVSALRPADRIACLRYNRRCVNSYNYNLLSQNFRVTSRIAEQVGDKKVAFTVRPSEANAGGWIGGEIREREFTFQFRIPVGAVDPDNPAVLKRVKTDPNRARPSPDRESIGDVLTAPIALPLKKETDVAFENVDDRVALIVNGEEVLSLEYESRPGIYDYLGRNDLLRESEHDLLLLASGAAAEVYSLRVYRDVYYTHEAQRRDEGGAISASGQYIQIESRDGESEYFPCGDNSPSSFDGRSWGTVPEKNMMGKAFVVFWPLWSKGFRWKFIH